MPEYFKDSSIKSGYEIYSQNPPLKKELFGVALSDFILSRALQYL